MNALVTGATGFVGSHLVEALSRRGDTVTALVRSPGKAARVLGGKVRLVVGDLDATAALADAAAGQQVVYHVAGVIAARNEAEFLHSNAQGTRNVLEAMSAAGGAPRLVLVSSMAAGGPAERGQPLDGTAAPRPVTQYGRSKLAGEEVVRGSRLRWTIIRPPMVYGPRDTEVLKVFKLAGAPLAPVFGDGTQELSAVYGPDLAEALIAAGTSEQAVGRTYYPCHPELFSSEQFVQAVGRAVRPDRKGNLPILHLPLALARGALTVTGTLAALAGKATVLTADKANEFFQSAWTGNPAPLARDTGWQAATSLDEGLALTARWYREAGWL